MPELLLELGTEELPASAVERAFLDLASKIEKELTTAGLIGDGSKTISMGTPRRLIVGISNVLASQPDSVKEQRGPSAGAAYLADGSPSPALQGFCRSQAVALEELHNDGQYVWATKKVPGRPAGQVLAEVLPKCIRSLSFDKTMRWGSSRMRFARPIRWILAAFGGSLVPFELETVCSGLSSFGHRFYAPHSFSATYVDQLLWELRKRFVEPDPEVRRAAIMSKSKEVAEGAVELSEALVEENVFLTEWPTPIAGHFQSSFLELPEPVLITAMAKHEKMFPVRDGDRKLTNQFVFVRNSGEDKSVTAGCEWVLNARFNDARFFFEEDKKTSLDEFRQLTSRIVFGEGLGTVLEHAERMERLALGSSHLQLAAKYAKADLSSGLVGELASLQGIIGGEYARREGLPEPVCWAISQQYNLALGAAGDGDARQTAIWLVILDQLDKLVGYLGRGQAPSGSSDPFALRRAASQLIDAAWLLDEGVDYLDWPDRIATLYADQGYELDREGILAGIESLFTSRYSALLPDVRYDVLEAVLGGQRAWSRPKSVLKRCAVTEEIAKDVSLVQTLTRPINIVRSAIEKGIDVGEGAPDPELIQSNSGSNSSEGVNSGIVLLQRLNFLPREANAESLRTLGPLIDAFFDQTMMMVEDVPTRTARLALNRQVMDHIFTLADVSKIVIAGD